MPRPVKKVSAPIDSSAHLGFKATSLRGSAFLQNEALRQSLPRQRDIRRAFSTQIPVCVWFLAKNNHDGKRRAVSELGLALDV